MRIVFHLPLNLVLMNLIGSIVGSFILSQLVSGMLLTIWLAKFQAFCSKFSSTHALKTHLFFILFLHSTLASFFFVFLLIHTYRTLYYRNHLLLYWIVGTFMFYISMRCIVTGYILPGNLLSERASLIMIRIASTMPYFGPILGTLLISYLSGDWSFDFRLILLFHALVAFNLVVLSFTHLLITHLLGSSTVEKANPFISVNFLHFVLTVEFWLWLLSSNVIYLIVRWSYLFHHNGTNFVATFDVFKVNSHLPAWYVIKLYTIVLMLAAGDFNAPLSIIELFFYAIGRWLLVLFDPTILYPHAVFFVQAFGVLTMGAILSEMGYGPGVCTFLIYILIIFLLYQG